MGIMERKGENIKLGKRIRSLRVAKKLTQQELGNRAEVNYKFLGEIERGRQNPSFETLVKIANAMSVNLNELLRFDHEISARNDMIELISNFVEEMPDEDLKQLLLVLKALYPFGP